MKLNDIIAETQPEVLDEGLRNILAAAAVGVALTVGVGGMVKMSQEATQNNQAIISQVEQQATSAELARLKKMQDETSSAFHIYASQPNQSSVMANTWRPIYFARRHELTKYVVELQQKYNVPGELK
jgi:uncharacterized protein HemX